MFLDDLEVNCEAARALGMTAVRFEDTDQAIAASSSQRSRSRAAQRGLRMRRARRARR